VVRKRECAGYIGTRQASALSAEIDVEADKVEAILEVDFIAGLPAFAAFAALLVNLTGDRREEGA